LTACADDDNDAEAVEELEFAEGVGDELVPPPDEEMIGQELTVEGTVIQIAGPNSFLIDETDLEGGRPIFAIYPDFDIDEGTAGDDDTLLDVGDRVSVQGTAERIVSTDFNRRFGVTFDPEVHGLHSGEVAVRADQVDVVERADEAAPRPDEHDESQG
jgi:hypothetical protein